MKQTISDRRAFLTLAGAGVASVALWGGSSQPADATLVGYDDQEDYSPGKAGYRLNILSATLRPAMRGIFSAATDQRAALLNLISEAATNGQTIEWGPIDLSLNVTVGDENKKGLLVPSGSRWVMHPNTVIRALPNSATGYQVLNLFNVQDVVIEGGGGRIIGERFAHTGTSGEFGMGLSMRGSKRVTVKELTIQDCWGDGIYIGSDAETNRTPCEGINLVRIISQNNRRTGMGVINVKRLSVLSSKFIGTGGTALHAGVDLEPNHVGEAILNAHFFDCDFEDNIGPGLMTAGPVSTSRGVYVDKCRFKNNGYAMASTIRDSFATNCVADGSTVSSPEYGGFTIVDGAVRHCLARNMRRSGFGAVLSGNTTFENNRCEYTGRAGGTEEDTALYINKTGGNLIVRANNFAGRVQAIRATGTASYVEIIGNALSRSYQASASVSSSVNPLRLAEMTVTGRGFIERNRFLIPPGSVVNVPLITLHPNANYVVALNKTEGWNRTSSNWLSQIAGTGSTKYGAGNWLPNGTFDKP